MPKGATEIKQSKVCLSNTESDLTCIKNDFDLDKFYTKYKEKGFIVLGFPSNDFLNQDPGSNDEIKKFCQMNYSITFPLFAKNPVTGDQKQPLYKLLTEEVPEELQGGVKWNFEKFLVGRDGLVIQRFSPDMTPEDPIVMESIKLALAK